MFNSQQQNAIGSLHNIDFGVFWASWGGSGKEPGSGNRVPGTKGIKKDVYLCTLKVYFCTSKVRFCTLKGHFCTLKVYFCTSQVYCCTLKVYFYTSKVCFCTLKGFERALLYFERMLLYFESVGILSFESILLYFKRVLLHSGCKFFTFEIYLYFESKCLYFGRAPLYFESIPLNFENIFLYVATMPASGCIDNQYSKGKEKMVINIHFKDALCCWGCRLRLFF